MPNRLIPDVKIRLDKSLAVAAVAAVAAAAHPYAHSLFESSATHFPLLYHVPRPNGKMTSSNKVKYAGDTKQERPAK